MMGGHMSLRFNKRFDFSGDLVQFLS